MPVDDSSRPRAGEFDIIRRYFAPLASGFPGSFDLRDDAAVLHPGEGRELVVTADAMVAGVHFLPDDPAGDIARKLLRVNLSDLAAMGAVALAYVVTTAFPRGTTEAWIAEFAAGFAIDQAAFALDLIGGDTVSTGGPLTLSLTAFGTVPVGRALRRSAAEVGDDIYVSGCIGDGAAGLKLLQGAEARCDEAGRQYLIARYRRPDPRTGLGPRLIGVCNACIDVSDGLVADIGHIAEESGVRAEIDLPAVPRSAACVAVCDAMAAITGGDDYELLFTAKAGRAEQVKAVADEVGVVVTRIGRISAGQGVQVLNADGNVVPLTSTGYRHF